MQRDGILPPLEEDPERIRDLADEVLSRDEFAPPDLNWWERFVRWLNDLLGDVDGPDADVGDPTALTPIAQLLLVLVAGSLILFVLWRIYKSWSGLPKRAKVVDEGKSGSRQAGTRRTVVDWSAEAADHEQAGRWAEAVRCWYRVAVARLADRELVRDVPGRTSGEYRYEVQKNAPDMAETFDQCSDVFDAVWYGGEVASPEQAERVKALSGAVGERASTGASPARVSTGESSS